MFKIFGVYGKNTSATAGERSDARLLTRRHLELQHLPRGAVYYSWPAVCVAVKKAQNMFFIVYILYKKVGHCTTAIVAVITLLLESQQ